MISTSGSPKSESHISTALVGTSGRKSPEAFLNFK